MYLINGQEQRLAPTKSFNLEQEYLCTKCPLFVSVIYNTSYKLQMALIFLCYRIFFLRSKLLSQYHQIPTFFLLKLLISCLFQGIILVYDITREETFRNIQKWLRYVDEVSSNYCRIIHFYDF